METRIAALERRLRWLAGYAAVLTLVALGAVMTGAGSRDGAPEIIRAKGLVIVDEHGRDRILVGAPIPASADRVRTDFAKASAAWGKRYPNMDWYKTLNHSTNGMMILDDHGFDRIVVGDPVPDPNIGARVSASTGLAINDAEGFERSGWGHFPKSGHVGLGLDHPGGEGLNLIVRDAGEAGMMVQGARGEQSAWFGVAPANGQLLGNAGAFNGYRLRTGEKVTQEVNGAAPKAP